MCGAGASSGCGASLFTPTSASYLNWTSLSDIHWLNVNDPGFPFVGVIEHPNFEPAVTYRGRQLVYLSKYFPRELPALSDGRSGGSARTLRHLRRMFPDLADDWVLNAYVWCVRYSQPIMERGYRHLIRMRLLGLPLCCYW